MKNRSKYGARCVLVSAIVLVAGGCASVGRGIADGALDGIQASEDRVAELERRLADTLAVYLGSRIKEEVLDQVDSTWSGMRSTLTEGLDEALDSVAVALRTDLNASLGLLIRENMDLLDLRGARFADSLGAALGASLGAALEEAISDRLVRAFSAAADSAGFRAMLGMRRGIEGEVTPAMSAAVEELREVVRQEVRKFLVPEALNGDDPGGTSLSAQLTLFLTLIGLGWIAVVHFRHDRALKGLRTPDSEE